MKGERAGGAAAGTGASVYRVGDPRILHGLNYQLFPSEDEPEWDRCAWWAAGDPVVGFAGARLVAGDKQTCFLERAGVHPIAQGKGLQRRLIRARLTWAKRQGCSCAITYCTADNVWSANNLWASGFRMYHPEWAWVGRQDILYFTKPL